MSVNDSNVKLLEEKVELLNKKKYIYQPINDNGVVEQPLASPGSIYYNNIIFLKQYDNLKRCLWHINYV